MDVSDVMMKKCVEISWGFCNSTPECYQRVSKMKMEIEYDRIKYVKDPKRSEKASERRDQRDQRNQRDQRKHFLP